MIKHFGLDRQYLNLKHELLEATHDAMKDGILVDGSYASILESWLTNRTGCEYAILVHSGTQALEIIAKYLVYNNFDTNTPLNVKVPDFTYVATMNAFVNTSLYARTYNNREFDIELTDVDRNGIMRRPEKEQTKHPVCTTKSGQSPRQKPRRHLQLKMTTMTFPQHRRPKSK